VSGSEDQVVSFAVGVDIGGTFTDCVVVSGDGALEVGKVATTPADRADGFFDSIGEAAAKFGLTLDELLARTERLVHGTTTGTNALVARTGARVGLLATAGHGDALFMMKAGGRSIGLPPEQLLDLAAGGPPAHYVDKTHVLEVIERVDSDGDVVVPLDEQQARAQVRDLMAKGVESIAVSLLWSIKNDAHERRLREIIGEEASTVFVSCGSELAGRVGEYERTTTAVMNAYIGPLMVDYVARIEERARSLGYVGTVLFAQCAGGALTGEETRRTPILTLQSGPVSGVMCSVQFSEATDTPHIITTDMGGTTYDVSIIRDKKPIMTDITIFERFENGPPDARRGFCGCRRRLRGLARRLRQAQRRAAERRRRTGAGLLCTRRHRTNRDGRGRGVGNHRSRQVPPRFAETRSRCCRTCGQRPRSKTRPGHASDGCWHRDTR
jgi:N-methylhydantoinase A